MTDKEMVKPATNDINKTNDAASITVGPGNPDHFP